MYPFGLIMIYKYSFFFRVTHELIVVFVYVIQRYTEDMKSELNINIEKGVIKNKKNADKILKLDISDRTLYLNRWVKGHSKYMICRPYTCTWYINIQHIHDKLFKSSSVFYRFVCHQCIFIVTLILDINTYVTSRFVTVFTYLS